MVRQEDFTEKEDGCKLDVHRAVLGKPWRKWN